MDCKITEKKILFYINNELSDVDMAVIKKHINECKNCSSLAKSFKESFSTITENKITEKDPYFYSRLTARMEQEKKWNWKIFFKAKPILHLATYILLGFFAIIGGHLITHDIEDEITNSYELTDEELFASMNYLSLNSDDIYVVDVNEFEE